MVELLTLGSIELRAEDGRSCRSVLAQPKRVAFLTYLAVAQPRGFHSRDKLYTLFWPDSDAFRARKALNQSVYVLRRALGEDVIERRGEGVGLGTAVLRCDAVEFERALDTGRLEEALELYRGDLLDGFHVPDAPEFERWVDGERGRLRRRAVDAAWALAERVDAADARRWAARAAELAPFDESAVARRIEMLARAGDRAEAVRVYDDFAGRLRSEMELEPSDALRALLEQVRSGTLDSAAVRHAAAVPRQVEPAPAAGPAESVEAADPPSPRASRRRDRRIAIALPLILLVFVSALWSAWQREPAVAPAEGRIAVLPFSIRGSTTVEYLGDGMVDLLSGRLRGVDGLQPIDPRALLAFMERTAGGSADPSDRGRAVAARFGAGGYVLGSVVEAGGRLEVQAALYDAAGALQATADGAAERPAEIFDVTDELVRELLADRYDGIGSRQVRMAALDTRSLPAFKAYLEGERHYWAGRYDAAVEAYEEALSHDSTFALASYRLSFASEWVDPAEIYRNAARAAVRHGTDLPPHTRRLLDARLAFLEFRGAESERLYEESIRADPTDIEAWLQLAETVFHWGWQYGRDLGESRAMFERVLELEPRHFSAVLHLARLAARDRRTDDLDSLVLHGLALDPDHVSGLELRTLQALADGRRLDARDPLAAELADTDPYWIPTWRTAMFTQNFDGAAHLARLEVAAGAVGPFGGGFKVAALEMAAGRPRRAVAVTRDLLPGDAERLRNVAALFYSLPIAGRDSAGARILARDMALAAEGDMAVVVRESTALARSLIAGLAADSIAARWLADLGQAEGSGAVRDAFADLFHARTLLGSGRAAAALELLDRFQPGGVHRPIIAADGSQPQPFFHLIRADALSTLRREREAVDALNSIREHRIEDLVFLAPSHLRRAQLYERLGETDRAIMHYTRFLELWSDPEPVYQPLADDARQRLAVLTRSER